MADGFDERLARFTGCGCPAGEFGHFPECPKFRALGEDEEDEPRTLGPSGPVLAEGEFDNPSSSMHLYRIPPGDILIRFD